MKCKCIKRYYDTELKNFVLKGDVNEFSEQRAKELIYNGFVEEVKKKGN